MESDFLEQLRVEAYEKILHDQRYNDDQPFLNSGRGLGLNEKTWICDGCDRLFSGSILKFKSLKCKNTFHIGFWVCQKCKINYGYPDASSQYGIVTYHPHWLLELHTFEASRDLWVLPKSPRQIRESSPLLNDFDRLRWIRADLYGKNDYRVLELEKIRERFRLLMLSDLSEKEMVCLFYRHQLKKQNHFIPLDIYKNNRHFPTIEPKIEFPEHLI